MRKVLASAVIVVTMVVWMFAAFFIVFTNGPRWFYAFVGGAFLVALASSWWFARERRSQRRGRSPTRN